MALEHKLRKHTEGDVTVFQLEGPLDGDLGLAVISAVRSAITGGRNKVVIDIGDVPYWDSDGVGALVAAVTMLLNVDGKMIVSGVSRMKEASRMKAYLDLTKLSTVFEFEEAPNDAVAILRS